MDKYKVLINDELYQTYNGLGQQSYRIHHPSQTMQDIVVLSFSREEQAFKASILNPSEHTLYLFNNNSLGFTVSRGIRFPHTRTNRSKMSKQHKR